MPELNSVSNKKVRNSIRPTGIYTQSYGFIGGSSTTGLISFATRFLAKHDYYGFDIVHPFMQTSSASLSVSCGKTTALEGSYSIISPQVPKVNGSNLTSVVCPTNGTQYDPKFIISDFVPLAGVAGDVIEVRSYFPSGVVPYSGSTISDSSSDPLPSGCVSSISGTNLGSDLITGNPAVNCLGLNVTSNTVCFIRFYTKQKTFSILHCGDSICKGEAGNISGQGKYSPLWIAGQLDARISPMVFGVGGQSQEISLVKTINIAKALKPNICLVPAFSPNDLGVMTSSIGMVTKAINELINSGITPALITPNPWSYVDADFTNWNNIRATANQLATDYGIPLIDYSTALEDPNVAGQMKAEYFGVGAGAIGKHPNTAGKLAEANAIIAGLDKFLDTY